MNETGFWVLFWDFANKQPGLAFLMVFFICGAVACFSNLSFIKHKHIHYHKGDSKNKGDGKNDEA
jgi:hypothetical protein